MVPAMVLSCWRQAAWVSRLAPLTADEVALKLFDIGVHRVGELDDDEPRHVDRA